MAEVLYDLCSKNKAFNSKTRLIAPVMNRENLSNFERLINKIFIKNLTSDSISCGLCQLQIHIQISFLQ